jgi:hypothetical protein
VRQAKFTIDEVHDPFLERHDRYGFKDRSAVVCAALDQLPAQIEQKRSVESAALYAVQYEQDSERGQIRPFIVVTSTIAGWRPNSWRPSTKRCASFSLCRLSEPEVGPRPADLLPV